MYAAPTQMPTIYQRYLVALGVRDLSIELIGTNNDVQTFTVSYDYNFPSGYASYFSTTRSSDIFVKNASNIIGKTATYTYNGAVYQLNSDNTTSRMGGHYAFEKWNTKQDGSGFSYIDGDAYFVNADVTLYAQWRKL